MKLSMIVAMMVCGWTLRGECSSAHQRYIFSYDGVIARLWDNRKKQFVWKREVASFDELTWSNDHRALVFDGHLPHHDSDSVLVWREGFRLRCFATLGDYAMGCLWSPDNRRLLVRYGISGDSDTDEGTLYCLELKPWPQYRYYKLGVAHKMVWDNSRTVTFWNWDIEESSATRPPRLTERRMWRVPYHPPTHRSRWRKRDT